MCSRLLKRRFVLIVLLTVGLTVSLGCTHVIKHDTPYYADGPYQIEGPQGDLKAGTGVWIVGKEGAYLRVWSLENIDVYVVNTAVTSYWQRRKTKPTKQKPAEQQEPLFLPPE